MADGSHLSPDFVGYETGIPNTPAAGYSGLLDFAGYPVGLPSVEPPAPAGNPRGGATIINIHHHIDPLQRKRRREDDEILILGRKRF